MSLIDGNKLLEEIKNMDLGYMQHNDIVECIKDAIEKQSKANLSTFNKDIKLLTKEEIINGLEETRACESELCELLKGDNVYFTVYPNTDPFLDSNYLGCTIVKCKEGYLSLPVDTYDFHNGFEQYDLNTAEIVDKELVEEYYNTFKRQGGFFRELLSQ